MVKESSHLLHAELFDKVPIVGAHYRDELAERSQEVADATEGMQDPDISILIRTRNNEARIEGLFEDIAAQEYNGNKQIVVVDTESTDRTREIAYSMGATIVSLTQDEFTYPKSLNEGFRAAENAYVLTLTNRTNFTNKMALRGITRWHGLRNFAGAYGAQIWDNESSIWESTLLAGMNYKDKRLRSAGPISEWEGGAMVANRSVVRKDAWETAGGYDESFERGGEDTDFAKRLLAECMTIVREPALSMHHSWGGLSLVNTLRRAREQRHLRRGVPEPFNAKYIVGSRPDLTEQPLSI